MADLPLIENAFLLIADGLEADYGSMYELELRVPQLPQVILDAVCQFVLPAWCDSHSHIVFSGSRENEFVDKIKGLTYAEIAAKGGGILNSAKTIGDTSEAILYDEALKRQQEVCKLGTGAIEIKSGYGLSVAGELKMLRVIKKLKANAPVTIQSAFLGAHTFSLEFKENNQG